MNFRKISPVILVIIVGLLAFSCSFTKTKIIEPVFTLTPDSISRDINSIIETPEVTVIGEVINTDGNAKTELTINLSNPKRLPEDAQDQKKLGENIAILIKNALKDPNSFSDYRVLFTKRIDEGGASKSSYIGYTFKSENLKNYIQIVSVGDQFDSSASNAIGKTIFSQNDPNIIAVFKYYNNVPGSPIKFNAYKATDSGMELLTSRNQEQILAGNNFTVTNLTTSNFYKIKELGTGKYKIEFLVSDTVAGSKFFVLE